MNDVNSCIIDSLLKGVREKFGRRLSTPSDFSELSNEIYLVTKERISISTIKRLMRYVMSNTSPRLSTLNILSQYIGYTSFGDYFKNNFK